MAVNPPPVLVALDVATAEDAVRMAKLVAPHVGGFKIGLGLLHGPGPATIAALAELGKPVFADAKLHDIPTQVGAAATRLGRWGARWVTAHVSGGEAMLRAAVADDGTPRNALHPIPDPEDLDAWRQLQSAAEAGYAEAVKGLAGETRAEVRTLRLGSATVHVATPDDLQRTRRTPTACAPSGPIGALPGRRESPGNRPCR